MAWNYERDFEEYDEDSLPEYVIKLFTDKETPSNMNAKDKENLRETPSNINAYAKDNPSNINAIDLRGDPPTIISYQNEDNKPKPNSKKIEHCIKIQTSRLELSYKKLYSLMASRMNEEDSSEYCCRLWKMD